MSGHFDYETLEELSKGIGLSQIQFVFDTFISELADFLKLQPLYQDINLELIHEENSTKKTVVPVLDFGVEKIIQHSKLIIRLHENYKQFLPFFGS